MKYVVIEIENLVEWLRSRLQLVEDRFDGFEYRFEEMIQNELQRNRR